MEMLTARMVGLSLAALVAVGADAAAQVRIDSRALEIELTGRLHMQWNSTSVDGPISNEFLIRRARLTAEIMINDWITGKVQPDYGEGELSLKDAYLRLSFDPALRATFGQFKRPFDLFELTSSTQILVIERAGGIRGVDTCAGPGGICSYSRFTEKLHYSDRDIGAMIDGELAGGQIGYMLSVTNGTGADTPDENGSKSYSGRVEYSPLADVALGANVALHDYENEIDVDSDYATALGADVEWGDFQEGLHVQAGVTAGDNWLNLDDAGDPTTFLTAQAIVTHKIPIGNRFVEAIEPVGRISWGDPDTDTDDDEGLLLTPGFVAFFSGRNKVAINADIWSPGEGDTEVSFKIQTYLHF